MLKHQDFFQKQIILISFPPKGAHFLCIKKFTDDPYAPNVIMYVTCMWGKKTTVFQAKANTFTLQLPVSYLSDLITDISFDVLNELSCLQ